MLDLLISPGERIIYRPSPEEDRDSAYERAAALYPDLQIEMDEAGNIIIMAPGSLESGECELEVGAQLGNWNQVHQLGHVFSPSAVFRLPNGAKRQPDASWLSNDDYAKLDKKTRQGFRGEVVPQFVIEVRSPSDRLTDLKDKCQESVAQGVTRAWLVDPYTKKSWIFSAFDTQETSEAKLEGAPLLPGFTLDLIPVWKLADN